VSHAFWLFGAVGIAGICSILFLWKRDPKWDDIALGAAEVAVAFGAVVLITGSIWGKAAWDVWWQWEPRLTMSLLLWLILVGYVLVRRFAGPSADRVAAGMAIFGMIGVPFIYTMVGQSSHPAAGSSATPPRSIREMRPAFWLSVCVHLWFSRAAHQPSPVRAPSAGPRAARTRHGRRSAHVRSHAEDRRHDGSRRSRCSRSRGSRPPRIGDRLSAILDGRPGSPRQQIRARRSPAPAECRLRRRRRRPHRLTPPPTASPRQTCVDAMNATRPRESRSSRSPTRR
jgi:hypothetical protein